MNVSRLRTTIWIVSALLTVGLGWYVLEIVSASKNSQSLVANADVRRVLEDVEDVSGPTRSLVSSRLIEETFYNFDWTGKPAPVVVDVEVPESVDAEPIYTPIAEILDVYFMQVDSAHPERSKTLIKYKTAANVVGEASTLGQVLSPGDSLAEPHQYASVASVSFDDGVTFGFEDAERPKESLRPEEYATEVDIPIVDASTVRRPGMALIPQGRRGSSWRPTQTTKVGSDSFQIGSEDAEDLEENYAHILSNEVRHRRHRDPKTGKFDGIEIQSVVSGSVAARHGAEEGDVIRSINGHPVTSVSEAITFVKNHEGEYSTWEVIVSNRGVERTVTYYSPSED
jgi:hypothetical protein